MEIIIFSCGINPNFDLLNQQVTKLNPKKWFIFYEGEQPISTKLNKNVELFKNEIPNGKAYNFNQFKKFLNSNEIIFIIDLDDTINLKVIDEFLYWHKLGWDIVYGKCLWVSKAISRNFPVPSFIPIHQVPWGTSHLFTFKSDLAKNIDEADLIDQNNIFFDCACDVAINLRLSEQTIKRKFVNKISYYYNDNLESNHHNNKKRNLQKSNKNYIYKKKKPFLPEIDYSFLKKYEQIFSSQDLLFFHTAINEIKNNIKK